MKLAFAISEEIAEATFRQEDRRRLAQFASVLQAPSKGEVDWKAFPESVCRDVEILITGWRTPRIPEELNLPRLKMIGNASGGVRQHLPVSLWERGVSVSTASSALGWGVAEFALAMMIQGSKRAFWMANVVRKGGWREGLDAYGNAFELFGTDVGIVGMGQSARHLIRLLEPFSCRCFVYDPYLSELEIVAAGGIPLDSLEALFERCRVVSLHAALTPQSHGLLRGEHFRRLQRGSLFVNTARAGLIEEAGFIAALREQSFVACLDVSLEEPPAADHPYRTLPNVMLTPHMAGAIRENRLRMGKLVADEIERFVHGEALQHQIHLSRLEAVA